MVPYKKDHIYLTRILLLFTITGCGPFITRLTYNDSLQLNTPVTIKSCKEAVILMDVELEEARYLARTILLKHNAYISEDTEIQLLATTSNSYTQIRYERISPNKTYVSVLTSQAGLFMPFDACEVVNEMLEMHK